MLQGRLGLERATNCCSKPVEQLPAFLNRHPFERHNPIDEPANPLPVVLLFAGLIVEGVYLSAAVRSVVSWGKADRADTFLDLILQVGHPSQRRTPTGVRASVTR